MIKIINKIAILFLILNIINPSIAMEDKTLPQHKETTPESPLLNLPDELKLLILTIGMQDIIKNNSIFDPAAGALQYINNIGLSCKDLRKFKQDLNIEAKKIIVNAFASEQKNLTKEELNDKISNLLSVEYGSPRTICKGKYTHLPTMSKEEEISKEKIAASLIIALSSAAKLSIRLFYYSVINPDRSETLPILVAIAKCGKYKNLIPLLLFYGANINSTDKWSDTVLMHAIKQDDAELVRLLLLKGADINAINNRSENALAIAQYARPGKVYNLIKEEHQKLQKNKPTILDTLIQKSGCSLC